MYKYITSKMLPRSIILIFLDVLTVLCAYSMGLLLRYDFKFSSIPQEYLYRHAKVMVVWVVVTITVFFICKMYHSIWSLASVSELRMICSAFLMLIPVYVALASWQMRWQRRLLIRWHIL